MNHSVEHDYIQAYQDAILKLRKTPTDKELQHRAVLSLARTGALDFAISEYKRYGLDAVTGHEDIMALGGRLSKDLYLASKNKAAPAQAKRHAKDAADKYDAAFQSTKGYYSGINAAAMALMADMSMVDIVPRIDAILNCLPPPEKLTAEDHYFIEATRAECFLLSGEIYKAKAALKSAVSFDPLNYTAHAATIKQFKMIAAKQGGTAHWLAEFSPPRPAHFAGHIHLGLNPQSEAALSETITDQIQKNDIGFGYGALAAGSDILIAEALLEQGAQLHVILPCPLDMFFAASVKPFEGQWETRFHDCIARAASVSVSAVTAGVDAGLLQAGTPQTLEWPNSALNQLAAQFAMGQAILKSRDLSVEPAQLLLWDEAKGHSHTSVHAQDWAHHGRRQLIIPVKSTLSSPASPQNNTVPEPQTQPFSYMMRRFDDDETTHFPTLSAALSAAQKARRENPRAQIALHVDRKNPEADAILGQVLCASSPQSILMSEVFASLLALCNESAPHIYFAGLITPKGAPPLRCYSADL